MHSLPKAFFALTRLLSLYMSSYASDEMVHLKNELFDCFHVSSTNVDLWMMVSSISAVWRMNSVFFSLTST